MRGVVSLCHEVGLAEASTVLLYFRIRHLLVFRRRLLAEVLLFNYCRLAASGVSSVRLRVRIGVSFLIPISRTLFLGEGKAVRRPTGSLTCDASSFRRGDRRSDFSEKRSRQKKPESEAQVLAVAVSVLSVS